MTTGRINQVTTVLPDRQQRTRRVGKTARAYAHQKRTPNRDSFCAHGRPSMLRSAHTPTTSARPQHMAPDRARRSEDRRLDMLPAPRTHLALGSRGRMLAVTRHPSETQSQLRVRP